MAELVESGRVTLKPRVQAEGIDGWLEEGNRLAERHSRLQWEVGDWWSRGEHAYGERAKLAVELFAGRYSYASLRELGRVARAIEPSRRLDGVSWSHHQVVASLQPADQDRWLKGAEEFPVRELRTAIKSLADGSTPNRRTDKQPYYKRWSMKARIPLRPDAEQWPIGIGDGTFEYEVVDGKLYVTLYFRQPPTNRNAGDESKEGKQMASVITNASGKGGSK